MYFMPYLCNMSEESFLYILIHEEYVFLIYRSKKMKRNPDGSLISVKMHRLVVPSSHPSSRAKPGDRLVLYNYKQYTKVQQQNTTKIARHMV